MKPLEVLIVEEDPRISTSLAETLSEEAKKNKTPIRYAPFLYDSSEDPLDQILNKDPDSVVISSKFKGAPLQIAKELKSADQHTSVIYLAHTDEHYARALEAQNRGEVNAVQNVKFTENDSKDTIERIYHLVKLINLHAYKKMNIGLLGFGRLGEGFAQLLLSGTPHRLKGFSSSRLNEEILSRIGFPMGHPRIEFKGIFEEILIDTDLLLMCTGERNAPAGVYPDRSDLFEYHANKTLEYGKRIKNAQYRGMILEFANSPAENLNLLSRIGIPKNQLSSPFNADPYRIIRWAMADLNTQGEVTATKAKRLDDAISAYTIGRHGAPDVSIPVTENLSEEERDLIKKAAEKAEKIGHDVITTVKREEIEQQRYDPYLEVQEASLDMIEEFARLKDRSSTSQYCSVSIMGQKGFLALPVEISYIMNEKKSLQPPHVPIYEGGPRISLDKRRFNKIEGETLLRLREYLEKQNEKVEKFLKER